MKGDAMKRHVAILLLLTCALGLAQYEELWQSEEVGLPQSVYVLGVQNTDIDPQLELIYRGEEPWRDGIVYIWALDLLTGELDQVTDEFYYIYTDPGKEPRLLRDSRRVLDMWPGWTTIVCPKEVV